jgi:hypothetical protein
MAAKLPKSTEDKNLVLLLSQIREILGRITSSLATIANVVARPLRTEVSGEESPGAKNRVVMSIGGRRYEMIQRWSSREIGPDAAEEVTPGKERYARGKGRRTTPNPSNGSSFINSMSVVVARQHPAISSAADAFILPHAEVRMSSRIRSATVSGASMVPLRSQCSPRTAKSAKLACHTIASVAYFANYINTQECQRFQKYPPDSLFQPHGAFRRHKSRLSRDPQMAFQPR